MSAKAYLIYGSLSSIILMLCDYKNDFNEYGKYVFLGF
jgi:hypothetical protein